MQTELQADLWSLMKFVDEGIPLTPENYPPLRNLKGFDALSFAVTHGVKHHLKSLGAISAELERADHGGVMDRQALERAAVKLFINSLSIARAVGLAADDILRMLPTLMK